jgi:uncharacterized membrane protein
MGTPKKERIISRGKGLLHHIRHTMGAGLLVAIPLGITLFILRFLFNLADGILAPFIRLAQRIFFGEAFYLPGLGVVVGLLVVYLAGVVASNMLGSYFVRRWNLLLARIPLVKTIYFAAHQVVEVMTRDRGGSVRRAVLVQFPETESFAFAYVTNESITTSGRRYITCFVPTAPNPTSGYVLFLDESEIFSTGMSEEETVKIIMSLGVVVPEVLHAERLQ